MDHLKATFDREPNRLGTQFLSDVFSHKKYMAMENPQKCRCQWENHGKSSLNL